MLDTGFETWAWEEGSAAGKQINKYSGSCLLWSLWDLTKVQINLIWTLHVKEEKAICKLYLILSQPTKW
jgi:hypothetical protein